MKRKEINLRAHLVLQDEDGRLWLVGEISFYVGNRRARVFKARLRMKPGQLILSDRRIGQVADVSFKSGEPSDPFGKWAFGVMKNLGSGIALHYPKMNIGGSISSDEVVKELPPRAIAVA
jgi:hypothetical protein